MALGMVCVTFWWMLHKLECVCVAVYNLTAQDDTYIGLMSLRIAILYICINGFHPFVCMPLIFHRVLFTCIMHIVFSALPFLGIIVHVLAARFYGTLYSFCV